MKFTKMHGAGNDYIYVDCTQSVIDNPSQVAIDLSDRHFGIGSDGLILIKKSDKADFFMEMYNADGSQGQMCGNGIRCVGKFVYDNGLTDKTTVTIDTLAGVKILELKTGADGKVETARVNMGAPILEAAQIPVDTKELKEYKGCETETIAGQVVKTPVVDETIVVEGKEYKVTAVSMNTPAPIAWIVPALTITTSPALTSILLSMSVIVLLLILSRISSLDASLESPQYRYDPGSLSTTYHISFFPYSFSFSRAYSSSG